MFTTLVVYLFLDVWPYATYSTEPLDPGSDATTWVRIVLLALSGLAIPLVAPRPFRASTPDAKPSEEDTASLLSAYTFTFLDGMVYRANRIGNVKLDDMPEVPEHRQIDTLEKRTFRFLDPVVNGKKNVIWASARVWSQSDTLVCTMRLLMTDFTGKELALMTLWVSLQAVAEFAGPLGIRNLLQYEAPLSPTSPLSDAAIGI